MNRLFITSDKVGAFVSVMYAKGIQVSVKPQNGEIVVHKADGGYEWVKVLDDLSFADVVAALETEALKTEASEESHE